MKQLLGKLQQSVLFAGNPTILKSIPETILYSAENLTDFLKRYEMVYVKHDRSGQGRGIFKVSKRKEDSYYCFNGYTIHGKSINQCAETLEEFHQILHPFAKLGKDSGDYIIQEGIHSMTLAGKPLSIRVHVQRLNGKWIIGGMYGKIGTAETNENGIVNSYRGAEILSMGELLTLHLNLESDKKLGVIANLERLAILTAEVLFDTFPNREYGMDLGLDQNRNSVLFEVNNTPGIGGFAQIENKQIWRRIVEIRKLQRGDRA